MAARRQVRCLVCAASRCERIADLQMESVEGDVRDAGAVRRAVAGCGAVLHLAGISGWSQIASPDLFPVIVEGTRNVLQAAQAAGVRRVVYVSSAVTAGSSRRPELRDETSPFSPRDARGMPYALAKHEAECRCLAAAQAGLDVVIVNPAEVYGPGDRDLITAGNLLGLLAGAPVAVCTGGTSIIHVGNVAEGIVRALDGGRSGERYLLGGDNLHHRELARLLLEVVGRRTPVVTVPAAVARLAGRVAAVLRLPFPVAPGVIPYATRYWFLDNRKARNELGMEFRSARETLAETLAWQRSVGRLR